MAKALEMSSQKAEIFTDAQGLANKVAGLNNEGITGNLLVTFKYREMINNGNTQDKEILNKAALSFDKK